MCYVLMMRWVFKAVMAAVLLVSSKQVLFENNTAAHSVKQPVHLQSNRQTQTEVCNAQHIALYWCLLALHWSCLLCRSDCSHIARQQLLQSITSTASCVQLL